jgi:fructosamine-3-kinase
MADDYADKLPACSFGDVEVDCAIHTYYDLLTNASFAPFRWVFQLSV